MEAFSLVYSIAMMIVLAAVAVIAVGCVAMLVVAHRKGRLRQALSGALAGFSGSRRDRPVEVGSGARGLASHDAVPEVHQVNPATGLPMAQHGVDVQGNPFGVDNRLD